MVRRDFSVLTVLVGFLAVELAGCSGSTNDDDESPAVAKEELRGGTVTNATGVVDYFLYDGEGTSAANDVCTGSMIAPNVVLTAAHCLDTLGSKTSDSGTGSFTIRYFDPVGGLRVVYSGSATWSVFPTYNGIGDGYGVEANDDIAIIKVDGRFAGTTYRDYLRIYVDSASGVGGTLDIFGAGIYTYNGYKDNKLRMWPLGVEEVHDWHIKIDNNEAETVCKGDSGGPWVRNVSFAGQNVPLIAGLASNMEIDEGILGEGDTCANNDPEFDHDNAYGPRITGPRVDWIETAAGIECDEMSTNLSRTYRRCFQLPLVEDVEYEGYAKGVGAALAASLATSFL